MTGATTACEARLIALLAEAARGPERDGLFALWLVLRAAEALLPPTPVSSRNHRRERFSSLRHTLTMRKSRRSVFTAGRMSKRTL